MYQSCLVLLRVCGLGLVYIYVHLNFIAETRKGERQAENAVWRTEVTDGTLYLLSSKPVSLLIDRTPLRAVVQIPPAWHHHLPLCSGVSMCSSSRRPRRRSLTRGESTCSRLRSCSWNDRYRRGVLATTIWMGTFYCWWCLLRFVRWQWTWGPTSYRGNVVHKAFGKSHCMYSNLLLSKVTLSKFSG